MELSLEHALEQRACMAMEMAYAPYSHFRVGAAVLAGSGTIYTGCNVENSSFGAACCAERTAVFSAVAAGERRIEAIAVTSDSINPTYPCGICRQVLAEFAEDGKIPVYCGSAQGTWIRTTLDALLPHAFSAEDMPVQKKEE